jgi:hypothetical protein
MEGSRGSGGRLRCVGGDAAARFEEHQIAKHQLLAVYLSPSALTDDSCSGRYQTHKSQNRWLGLPLMYKADAGVDGQGSGDDTGIDILLKEYGHHYG